MALSIMPLDSVAYAVATWDDQNEDIFSSGYSDKACIVKGRRGAGKNFQVAGTSSPVTVEEGVLYLLGKRVVNTSSINVNVVSPITNPRIDRVIVKYVFATDAVTVELLGGTEDPAPTAPALTQIDGNTYEVSLAQLHVTTGGVITVTNERRWARPLGLFIPGEIKAIKCTLGGTASKHPIDPDLGSADEDWALCDGGTYNGYVTYDLRDRMIIGAGSTYSAGTTYGAATVNLAHTHDVGTLAAANESAHVHAFGTLAAGNESAHTHASTGLTTGNAGSHSHNVNASLGVPAPVGSGMDDVSYSDHVHTTDTVAHHTHAVNGSTAAGSAHTHTLSGSTAAGAAHTHALSGATASAGSAAQSVLNPCLAVAYFMYAPAI